MVNWSNQHLYANYSHCGQALFQFQSPQSPEMNLIVLKKLAQQCVKALGESVTVSMEERQRK